MEQCNGSKKGEERSEILFMGWVNMNQRTGEEAEVGERCRSQSHLSVEGNIVKMRDHIIQREQIKSLQQNVEEACS